MLWFLVEYVQVYEQRKASCTLYVRPHEYEPRRSLQGVEGWYKLSLPFLAVSKTVTAPHASEIMGKKEASRLKR